MKKILFLIIPFLVFIPIISFAESSRTGFVDGTVWYSSDQIREGDSIRIYTAVFNGESSEIRASVDFIDNDVLLATRDIVVASGDTETVSISWKVEVGSHDIVAKIRDIVDKNGPVLVSRNETKHSRFSVTKDISIDTARSALSAQVGNIVDFKGGVDLGGIDGWFDENLNEIEAFRNDQLLFFQSKKVDIKEKAEKEEGGPVKFMTFLHLYFLAFVVFVFSISIIFYLVLLLVAFMVLKILWRVLKKMFRKKYDEE